MDSISEFPTDIWANPLYRKLILSMLVVLGTFLLQIIARQVLEQKAKADERFARRFAKIVEKHDKNAYGG